MKYQTRVIQFGAFWKVQILNCGVWQTMQDNYLTRDDARQHRDYWAQR
jgi:hypothetical protein